MQRREAVDAQYAAAMKRIDNDEVLLEHEIMDESEMRLAVEQLAC